MNTPEKLTYSQIGITHLAILLWFFNFIFNPSEMEINAKGTTRIAKSMCVIRIVKYTIFNIRVPSKVVELTVKW